MPKILLGLGATCLLVAAVIFLAVAWSWLGVGGRTAVLVGLTVTTAVAGQWLARRDLGVAAEALTTVALGLVVLDVFGAENAGWLGTPTDEPFLAILGTTLLAVSLGLCVPAVRLFTPQVAAPLGLGIAVLGLGTTEHHQAVAALAVLCFAALALLGRTLGTVVLPWTSATGAGLAFVALTGLAVTDASEYPTFHGLWVEGHGFGMLAVAALVLLPVGDRPRPRRPAAAGLRLLGLGPHLRGRGPGVRRGRSPAITLVAAGVLGGLGGGGGGGPAPVVRRPAGAAGRVAAGPGSRSRRCSPRRRLTNLVSVAIPLHRRLAGAAATRSTTSRTRCCSPSRWRSWGWPPH